MSLSPTTSSPTSVDTDYLTLEHFAWSDIGSTKRKQVDESECKRRHRETQRRYLQRKRARIAVLQTAYDKLELQHQLMKAQQEAAVLRMENAVMRATMELDAQCESAVCLDVEQFDFRVAKSP